MKKKKMFQGKIFGITQYDLKIEKRLVHREIIEHPGAAAMLAFDENDQVILVKQHRFPHGYILEIPAGTLEKGEEPKECAFREMIEETGYKAQKMIPLLEYYPSVGYNSEVIHCFLAKGLKKIKEIEPDNDEFITLVKMDLKKLMRMIKTGKIIDSKTICAVLTYAAKNKITI